METLIAFSHLRWNFVFQRPQHLHTRLAAHYRVLFVEEPVYDPDRCYVQRLTPHPGIEVLRAHTPVKAPGFHDAQMPYLQRLFAGHFASHDFCDHGVAWFHTPMALPLLRHLRPSVVAYDCMDDLASFKAAPPALRERERTLMRLADVVFTGGLSLYRARRGKHANLHCFPSSVDAAHFAAAKRGKMHEGLAAIPGPRLGYIGVIDERVDLRLTAEIADARPDWHLVLVGPVAKIDEAAIPMRPNIHRLPLQQYQDLPSILAGFDVALMPFAINEATRSISPTKTLEYMAAGRPVVSTPVRDVVDSYAGTVEIASGADAFVAACDQVLGENEAQRGRRATAMSAAVAATSWDSTVAAMHAEIEKLRRHRERTARLVGTLGTVVPSSATASATAAS
jgi:glycosyltransferase involved in cell wall biosynthesis